MSIEQVSSLSAMERRQRRKERILGNSEARIQSLFTGGLPVSEQTSTTYKAFEPITKPLIENTKVEKFFGVSEADDEIACVPPNYAKTIESFHLQIISFIGVIFALLHVNNVITTVIPIWLTIILAYHLYRLTHAEKFPNHGYTVNLLLAGGIDERIVRYGGFILDAGTAAFLDSVVMAFTFVAVVIMYRIALFFI